MNEKRINPNEKYGHFTVPYAIFEDCYNLSYLAILLYGLLCNRKRLSIKNGKRYLEDGYGFFVYCTVEEICQKFNCSKPTALKALRELKDHSLIMTRRTGSYGPDKIFVLSIEREPEDEEAFKELCSAGKKRKSG